MKENTLKELTQLKDILFNVGFRLDNLIVNTDFNDLEDGEEVLYVLQRTQKYIDDATVNMVEIVGDYDTEIN